MSEEPEVTVEERLNAAGTKIAELKRDVRQTVGLIVGLFVAAVVCMVLYDVFGGKSEPPPSNRDASVEDLLSTGYPHCYDSAEERAAARQRALAAIDRIRWQSDHPATTDQPENYSMVPPNNPPPVQPPSVIDTPPPGASWNANRCFEIRKPGT
jgi:hypothetical protein